MSVRGGFTLIELVVAVVILGLLGAVTTASLRPAPAGERERTEDDPLARARRSAILEGRPVWVVADSTSGAVVVFLPDGRALGDGLDPLTGRRMER